MNSWLCLCWGAKRLFELNRCANCKVVIENMNYWSFVCIVFMMRLPQLDYLLILNCNLKHMHDKQCFILFGTDEVEKDWEWIWILKLNCVSLFTVYILYRYTFNYLVWASSTSVCHTVICGRHHYRQHPVSTTAYCVWMMIPGKYTASFSSATLLSFHQQLIESVKVRFCHSRLG